LKGKNSVNLLEKCFHSLAVVEQVEMLQKASQEMSNVTHFLLIMQEDK
jgi:hypothetical protein